MVLGPGWGDDAIDAKTRSMMNLKLIGALVKCTNGKHAAVPLIMATV